MRLPTCYLLLSTLTAAWGQTPSLTTVVNAASFAAGTLAPGSAASIFGSDLAATVATPSAYPLPTNLGNAAVYVNGVAAPLTYVSPGQINFQVPWEAGIGASSVVVIANSNIGNQLPVQIAAAAPGIFSGWVFSSAYGPAAGGIKLHAGEYLTILATGLGAVDAPPATGTPLADAKITNVLQPVTVTIGGVQAKVSFAGLAPPGPDPYNVGLYHVNVQVPANVPAGDAQPVIISVGGARSNAVPIAVASGSAPSIAKFTELAPSNTLVARAITSEDTCPAITIDGVSQPMKVRAAPALPFYPVLSCDSLVPATAKAISVEGQSLPLPVTNPDRITVLGDTGCRMDGTASQACNDTNAWPIDQIAASAIATNPQLLIHDGDYHYREVQCFPSVAGCQGSPWGYNWDVWREDLFKPFKDLLSAAPWIFVRGNHEGCDRAGEGWFRFLDPRTIPATCQTYTDPYTLTIGSLQLVHLDSAAADDVIVTPEQTAVYAPMFDTIRAIAASSNTWIITHRPIWGIRSNLSANAELQAASGNDLGKVQMVLSGHTHTFQTYVFSPARAPQLVIGNSGDNLAANPTIPIVGANIGNAVVTQSTIIGGFGFSTMAPAGNGNWNITSKDRTGKTTATCVMQPNVINCTQ